MCAPWTGAPAPVQGAKIPWVSDPTRLAILDAAETAFKLEPYNRVSVARVADHAHVSVGAIYHHVGDKEGLHAAVVERMMERLVEEFLRPPFLADEPAHDRLVAATLSYVRYFEERHADFVLLSATQHDARESEHARRFAQGTLKHVTSIMGEAIRVVEEWQETGEVRPGNPGGIVVLVWSALYGMCTLSRRFPGPVASATGRSGLMSLAESVVLQAIQPDAQPSAA